MELCSGGIPDMGKVGQALVELAADEEYFTPLIGQIPAESPGVHWLVKPERGPRLGSWCLSVRGGPPGSLIISGGLL